MGWLKLDDAFGDHPKVVGLSDRAFRAHVLGMVYCARYLTDGHVPRAVGPKPSIAKELERAGLWTSMRGGWQIHDWLDWNPSRAETEAERERWREQRVGAGKARAASAQRAAGRFAPADSPAGDQRDTSEPLALPLVDATSPVPVPVPKEQTLATGKPPRPRDELFEALAEVENADLDALTRSARGKLNDATKQLRDIGATPQDVAVRARTYRRVHPTWDLTAQALVKHWPSLNGAAPVDRYTPSRSVDDMTDEEIEELTRRD